MFLLKSVAGLAVAGTLAFLPPGNHPHEKHDQTPAESLHEWIQKLHDVADHKDGQGRLGTIAKLLHHHEGGQSQTSNSQQHLYHALKLLQQLHKDDAHKNTHLGLLHELLGKHREAQKNYSDAAGQYQAARDFLDAHKSHSQSNDQHVTELHDHLKQLLHGQNTHGEKHAPHRHDGHGEIDRLRREVDELRTEVRELRRLVQDLRGQMKVAY